jgi:hypothetical protein
MHTSCGTACFSAPVVARVVTRFVTRHNFIEWPALGVCTGTTQQRFCYRIEALHMICRIEDYDGVCDGFEHSAQQIGLDYVGELRIVSVAIVLVIEILSHG